MPTRAEKRTHAEAFPEQEKEQQENEVEQEGVGSGGVIILHPGSSTLHLGLSTDPAPQSLPHLIAYRSQTSARSHGPGPRDPSLVLQHEVEITPDLESQRENGLAAIRQSLAESRTSVGMGECEVEREEYVTFNGRIQPVARNSEDLSCTDISAQPRFIIGNDALYLPPDSDYVVFKPLRRGKINVGAHCSLTCTLSQLEDLWTRAIEDYLEIPHKDFKYYRVILLVGDTMDRTTLKEFMNILLLRMEFAAAFVHHESICACYSAGLSSACVVDVGDETTHVCCVEDGMSNPNTRVTLYYGGSDITRLFYWLVKQINFPYKECSADSRLDGVLLKELKESVCHLDPAIWGARDHQFTVMSKSPGVLLDYEIKMADEAMYAPMGVFFPSAFCLPDDCRLMTGQEVLSPDSEDLCDEGHWTEGQSQQTKTASSKPQGGANAATASDQQSESSGQPEATRRLRAVPLGKILGLDQAIHFSIDCASSIEIKKKLYGSILLIGGGLAFPGAANLLQTRLELKLPVVFARGSDNIEVFSNPRDLEPSVVAWRGGAVLCCLDTCHELWVERQEWEFSGVRLLRERAPFQW